MENIEKALFDPKDGLFGQMSEIRGMVRGASTTLKLLAWMIGTAIAVGMLWFASLEARGKVAHAEEIPQISHPAMPQDAIGAPRRDPVKE